MSAIAGRQAMTDITRLTESDARAHLDQFIALLTDTVDHGASVGFLRPLDATLARDYWHEVFAAVARGTRILLTARIGHDIVGSVQLDLAMRPNGRHRAEVQKLIVRSRYRRQGIASELMQAIEREARAAAANAPGPRYRGAVGSRAFLRSAAVAARRLDPRLRAQHGRRADPQYDLLQDDLTGLLSRRFHFDVSIAFPSDQARLVLGGGPFRTRPSSRANSDPCHGQTTEPSFSVPSDNGPPRCEHECTRAHTWAC
jgi:GNAT superfamily N-acetyltransferase